MAAIGGVGSSKTYVPLQEEEGAPPAEGNEAAASLTMRVEGLARRVDEVAGKYTQFDELFQLHQSANFLDIKITSLIERVITVNESADAIRKESQILLDQFSDLLLQHPANSLNGAHLDSIRQFFGTFSDKMKFSNKLKFIIEKYFRAKSSKLVEGIKKSGLIMLKYGIDPSFSYTMEVCQNGSFLGIWDSVNCREAYERIAEDVVRLKSEFTSFEGKVDNSFFELDQGVLAIYEVVRFAERDDQKRMIELQKAKNQLDQVKIKIDQIKEKISPEKNLTPEKSKQIADEMRLAIREFNLIHRDVINNCHENRATRALKQNTLAQYDQLKIDLDALKNNERLSKGCVIS